MPIDDRERALGALQGLALGDALGMPTQSMSPAEIERRYGRIAGLVDAVPEQPIAPSMPAGAVTDDTEQALLLAELLIAGGGRVEPMALARALLDWEDDMRARGSLDLLGPSTKVALERVRDGEDPLLTGRFGTTNGAAMRVTPVGIAFSMRDRSRFAEAVHESCLVTHDTRQGWEAAGLVAAAVSAGIDGLGVADAIDAAVELLAALPARGHWSAKASVLERSRTALAQTEGLSGEALERHLRDTVGTSVDSTESIPAALVLARRFADDPFAGLCAAAGLGGDTDTVAAMAGAILGACLGPAAFPASAVERVETVSGLDLVPVRDGLMALRDGRGASAASGAVPTTDPTHPTTDRTAARGGAK